MHQMMPNPQDETGSSFIKNRVKFAGAAYVDMPEEERGAARYINAVYQFGTGTEEQGCALAMQEAEYRAGLPTCDKEDETHKEFGFQQNTEGALNEDGSFPTLEDNMARLQAQGTCGGLMPGPLHAGMTG